MNIFNEAGRITEIREAAYKIITLEYFRYLFPNRSISRGMVHSCRAGPTTQAFKEQPLGRKPSPPISDDDHIDEEGQLDSHPN
jgi:hypothetical protein